VTQLKKTTITNTRQFIFSSSFMCMQSNIAGLFCITLSHERVPIVCITWMQ